MSGLMKFIIFRIPMGMEKFRGAREDFGSPNSDFCCAKYEKYFMSLPMWDHVNIEKIEHPPKHGKRSEETLKCSC